MSSFRKLALISFFAAASAAAINGLDWIDALRPRLRVDHKTSQSQPLSEIENLIYLPLVDQGTNYTCGVAALQSVMYYYDSSQNYSEAELAKLLKSDPESGTRIHEIEAFAKSRGYDVKLMHNMTLDQLQDNVRRGIPVIVLLQAWRTTAIEWRDDWDNGHYAVVNGFDRENLYFMDPSMTGTYAYIPIAEFLERWHDVDGAERFVNFGMTITKGQATFRHDVAEHME